MEIYIANSAFQKLAVLDEFDSFIWTERYSSYGDFSMSIPPGSKWAWLNPGSYIMHSDTSRVMLVETREETEDESGNQKVTIEGRSLETYLDSRVIFPNNGSLVSWSNSGPVGYIVKTLVSELCVEGIGYTPLDVIPGLYVADTTTTLDWTYSSIKIKSLYTAVKELCDSMNMGFRIILQDSSPTLRFEVFEGRLRNGVVFSSRLENLTQEHTFMDWSNYKNTAYVWAKDGTARALVPSRGGSIYREGLDRRVIHVDANDIDPTSLTEANLNAALNQRGREELTKHNKLRVFDGEILPGSGFRYGAHYNIGDKITLKDRHNNKHEVRVTEYIWSSDSSGERSYPTFTSTREEEGDN